VVRTIAVVLCVFSHYTAALSNVGKGFLTLHPVQTERVRVINIFLSVTSGSTDRESSN